MEKKGLANWRDYFKQPTGKVEQQRGHWNLPEEYHQNNWIAEETNARLDDYAKKQEPFFLWASFFDPHPPYLVPSPWSEMYAGAGIPLPRAEPGEHEKSPLPSG